MLARRAVATLAKVAYLRWPGSWFVLLAMWITKTCRCADLRGSVAGFVDIRP